MSPKPKRPVEEVRAELLQNRETAEIARNLGLPLEEYVEKVLGYYQDPAKEPQIYLTTEEQVRAAGVKPTTEKDVLEWLQKVDKGEIDLRPDRMKDAFGGPAKPKSPGS